MNLLKQFTLALFGIVAAGCDFVHPPTAIELAEASVVVHAVLAAGSDRAAVLLTRPTADPFSEGALPFDPESLPVSGAEVLLIADGDSMHLAEAAEGFPTCFSRSAASSGAAEPAGPGCYAGRVPAGIHTGAVYRLHIRLPDGHSIHGEAVPPPLSTVVELEPEGAVPIQWGGQTGFTPVGTVRVRFDAPEGVAGVGLVITGPVAAFRNSQRDEQVQCAIDAPSRVLPVELADHASVLIRSFHCFEGEGSSRVAVRPDSVHARLHVTSYDAALMRYMASLQEAQVEPEAAAQGVTGALGLFAGESTLVRTITLVPAG